MENKFSFIFSLDQEVVTPFGDNGLVEMLGFDDGGRKYYVQTATSSNWFKESQLQGKMNYVGDFVKTVCEQGDGYKTPSVDLYPAFKEYCSGNDFPIISRREFFTRLTIFGFIKMKRAGVIYWLGLRLVGSA